MRYRGDHSSGTLVTERLEQPTLELGRAALDRSSTWPCSERGLPCHRRYRRRGGLLPHRFTLTWSARAPRAVCFLLHCPRGFPHRALPGVLLCGARTFLPTSGAERSPLLRRRGGSYHGRGAPARGVSIVVRLSMVRDPAQRRDQATSGGHSAAIRRSGARQARGRAGSTQRRCRGCPPGGRLAADRCGRALRRPPRRAAGPP